MKKFTIAALLLLSATLCFGQAPMSALNNSTSDVYVGYVTTYPDYVPQLRLNGGEIAYTRNLSAHWGIVASGTAAFGTIYHVREYSGTVGAKYNFATGRLRPYATLQTGFAYLSAVNMYNHDHHPPIQVGKRVDERGLTYRGGLGADIQLNRRVYWRLVQWDVQPQPWARDTPFYVNWSSGIGLRF